MSIYEMDKAIWQVIMEPQQRDRFVANPAEFLAGRDLTADERRGLVEHDYALLYRLGAHPALLGRWIGRVVPERSPTFMKECFESVRPYGYPDFAT